MSEDGEPFALKPIPHSNATRCAKFEEQKQKARDAALEVLEEVKARREARKARICLLYTSPSPRDS